MICIRSIELTNVKNVGHGRIESLRTAVWHAGDGDLRAERVGQDHGGGRV